MKLVHLIGIFPITLVFSVGSLVAQKTEPPPSRCAPEAMLPPFMKSALCTISSAYHRPLHPIVRGIAPGGGLGAGFEYDGLFGGRWHAAARTAVTVRRSWSAEVGAGYRGARAGGDVCATARLAPA